MPRPTQITIDLQALRNNARLARQRAEGKKIMAAVKADAYGHGLAVCATTLAPFVDAFATAFCEEAKALHALALDRPVLVLEGPFDLEDWETIIATDSWAVLHSEEQLTSLESLDRPLQEKLRNNIWLKVDTGMHRLGVAPNAVASLLTRLARIGIVAPTIISHLGNGEDAADPLTQGQVKTWQALVDALKLPKSLLNSAGFSQRLSTDCDWHRLGYMLYGGSSVLKATPARLHPVMTLTSQVMALRHIPTGDVVGYGGRWKAQRDSVIATVAVGYGDGYPRTANDGTPVLINGVICPLVGRVSMDMITVDVTDHDSVTVGSPVQLWGDQLSVDRVASHAQTIGYELLTRLPNRLPRLLSGDP